MCVCRQGESKSPASSSLFVAYSFYAWIAPAVIVGGSVASDLFSLDEPLLRPIRRFIPSMSGIDLSPLVLLLGIFLIQRIIAYYIYPNVF